MTTQHEEQHEQTTEERAPQRRRSHGRKKPLSRSSNGASSPAAAPAASPAATNFFAPYIYGLHESGGEHLMLEAGRPGWVVELASVGLDGGGNSPADFTRLSGQGLGVIVRLHNGYEPNGCIPPPAFYDDFAESCARFVARSAGCHIWIIGNEPNHAAERPHGLPILPAQYADCYRRCRAAIRRLPGHEQDLVLVAGPAPWNAETRYPGNPSGDWARYFADTLAALPTAECDGFAIHTYTRRLDPSRIRIDVPYNADGYRHLRDEFGSYKDFLEAVPSRLRDLPVFITETDPTEPTTGWEDGRNVGWVRTAYEEIANWNANPAHQPIQALVLYRWPPAGVIHDQPQWSIADRPGIIEDFKQALRALPPEVYRTPAPRPHLAAGAGDRRFATIPRIYTNQHMINALHDAALAMGLTPWALLERAGLSLIQLASAREAIYQGPALEALPGLSGEAFARVRSLLLTQLRSQLLWRGVVDAPDGLNLRTGPGVENPVLRTLADKTPVEVLATLGDWLYCALEGEDGYLYAAYVKPIAPVEEDEALALPASEQIAVPSGATAAERRAVETWNRYGGFLRRLSARLNIDPGAALAVLLAESAGDAFGPDGRMIIRFEVHVFRREWNPSDPARFDAHFRFDPQRPASGHAWRPTPDSPWREFHGNQAAEWEVFTFARSLDERAAMRSISMGLAQIMGFNHAMIGYPTVQEMFEAFQRSERAQLEGMFRFIEARSLVEPIRRRDFLAFATGYNGAGNAPPYAAIIRQQLAIYDRLIAPTPVSTVAATTIEEARMTEAIEPVASSQGAALPMPTPPSMAMDPELYDAWRKHVERGFENNNRMFDRTLNAFMYPYWLTVGMYVVLFLVGVGALIVAARLSFESGKEMYTLLFGGVGVVAFLTFFLTRPLQALEENLQFITWLGLIYNTYWTRLAYITNQESVQQEVEAATADSIKKLKDLLDTHAERSSKRPGLR